jgi:hypothetical protein
MSVQEIELAIQRLPPAELAQLSAWFAEYRHEQWDAEIANDLESGRLDKLLGEVEQEYKAGHAKPL